MITVYFNSQPLSVPADTNLRDILALATTTQQTHAAFTNVAAVVNECIVPKSQWPHYQCQASDNIELFAAVAGG